MPRPLKWYQSLTQARVRRQEGVFLIEGPRAVAEILRGWPDAVQEILVSEDADFSTATAAPLRTLTVSQCRSISPSSTPQGVVAVVSLPPDTRSETLPADPRGDVLLCEGVQDPGNVGSLLRSAAAFGFAGAILTEKCADPFGPKAIQATAGSVLSLWIRRGPHHRELVSDLQGRGYTLVLADAEGDRALSAAAETPLVVGLGSEGNGFSQDLTSMADQMLSVPIDRTRVESLNVAAAGAVVMHLAASRRSS